VKNLDFVKEKLWKLSESQTIQQITMKDMQNWIYDGDNLRHLTGGYFSVIGLTCDNEHDGLILDQRETGLIGLLVHKKADELYFLLQYRCEPGLSKGCNLTTTVQATPSNYIGRHGGKKNFGVDIILQSNSKNRIIFDSFDYDYGAFFLGKIKRFVVVEVDEFLAPPEGFEWIRESLVRTALRENYLFSTDLRMMIGKYFSSLSFIKPVESGPYQSTPAQLNDGCRKAKPVRIDSLRNVKVTESGMFQGIPSLTPVSEIGLVRAKSLTREVSEWTQPLLKLNCIPVVSLLRANFEGEGYSLCKFRVEPGISDNFILGPTYVSYLDGPQNEVLKETEVVKECEVIVSGEGARFMQTNFLIQLYRNFIHSRVAAPSGFIWVKDVEMKRFASSSMVTSVELRYCLSLV
jgi:oxidase EvaA